jgi:hypothetical protein
MLSVHEGPVTGLSLHATGDYILTTSTDHCWAFSGQCQSASVLSHLLYYSWGFVFSFPLNSDL